MMLAPLIAFTATPRYMSDGVAGVGQTLRQMRALVKVARIAPAIRQAATNIVWLTPEKDEYSECAALFEFVRDRIRYTRDIHEVETLATPEKTLEGMFGDCDDQTMLLCALFESAGYGTRFVVAAYGDDSVFEPAFEHVYCQVFVCGEWIDCDPTEQQAFGWAPPNPTRIAMEKI